MKKIIGILGVAVIAATMFFNTNNVNGYSSDASLASLVTLNSANAQNSEGSGINCNSLCTYRFYQTCTYTQLGSDFKTMTITCHDEIKK